MKSMMWSALWEHTMPTPQIMRSHYAPMAVLPQLNDDIFTMLGDY
ncbi:hypothetical protein CORMATOL_02538 [Corynebacterium matruchotii ATCC 33806]|uniref:Uncharacterized protein n=1 Tax=Corynebacterium matruchotii ATCC 33806 TaxID=566549 RepID=C0E6A5_9CORY|nr:hypothetical protein CORMATOL_02538 [Corynebacterium matruchotii ATCC 33806]